VKVVKRNGSGSRALRRQTNKSAHTPNEHAHLGSCIRGGGERNPQRRRGGPRRLLFVHFVVKRVLRSAEVVVVVGLGGVVNPRPASGFERQTVAQTRHLHTQQMRPEKKRTGRTGEVEVV
jgi:hypothetical protein